MKRISNKEKAKRKIETSIKHLKNDVWIPDIISLLEDAIKLLKL